MKLLKRNKYIRRERGRGVVLVNVIPICFCVLKVFLKKFKFFLFFTLLQINIYLDYFDALI
jgi:hypothetical protein